MEEEAPLFTWPWQSLGDSKIVLYGLLLARAIYSIHRDCWGLHVFLLCMSRLLMHQLWNAYSNMLFLTHNRLILKKGVDFRQIDQELHWDNFILLQAIVTSFVLHVFPPAETVPTWDKNGVLSAVVLHAALSEPLFYAIHRRFHGNQLFTSYHFLHHSSPVPQPFTAGHASFLEQLALTVVMGIPLVASFLIGGGSIGLLYCYVLGFDSLRCLGHSNVEIVPHRLFEAFPFMQYILYTPTYHILHHEEGRTNFCLFMPLFDALGNTLNERSWDQHRKNRSNGGRKKKGKTPDFVFLAHIVDLSAALHAPFLNRAVASRPYRRRVYLIPFLPVTFVAMLIMWAKANAFLVTFYTLRNRLHQTWVIPRFGFQYFLPFAAAGINKQIEDAILRADRSGVKVVGLAALNKNEALNGGGTLFVNKHPDLRVRIVHGNTLTAAVILNEIPAEVTEVFLTGATSKLGRAIALYLCRKRVTVLMLTASTARFRDIQKEAAADGRKFLVQVTRHQAAQNCKTWIMGKWITQKQQRWAPPGTHFHQFVVPPIPRLRRDCTYSDLAAMRLPNDVQGLGFCEYTMERGVVHACHAGGAVHALEGWSHHEVGAIDVDRIDVVWRAALRLGFTPIRRESRRGMLLFN